MIDDTSSGELAGDDLQTWAGLATLLEWLPSALDAQLLRDSGITHFEYGILYALAEADERTLRMSVLAGFANSSLSRLSRAVTRLENRGWVTRHPDPADGRYTLAVLTAAGVETCARATPGHVQTVNHLALDRLTAAQKRQLQAITRRILPAIAPDTGWKPPTAHAARD
ncbi:MarR family winged helix-turn-helix transcriptional regulator [Herbiconiux flava]|uniref:DNA-binding MarR family transcriptional regulator n=1 Tax=Herbiconiux flava TaxID=881268 RepID=A0A852SQV7_9MICO|nr:MarR family transcriptional regulator [Herbiconiux flava]NYD71216.1 DNA-binding MarR family transcriptional regulator [Herbiconiux flava]